MVINNCLLFGAPAERATTNRRPNPKSSVFSLGRNCSTAKWQKLNFIIPVPKKLLFYEQELFCYICFTVNTIVLQLYSFSQTNLAPSVLKGKFTATVSVTGSVAFAKPQ